MKPIVSVWLFALLLVCNAQAPALAADDAGANRYAGRPLAEVLDELRDGGLKLIYSSEVVTPDMVVREEPQPRSPRKMIAQLLAPHGLKVEQGPGGTLLVVRVRESAKDALSPIRGTVRDATSGLALAEVMVEVVETELGAETDADGKFEIAGVAMGSYTVKASLPGYLVQRIDNVRVVATRPTELLFRLLPSPEVVEAVVVTPSSYRLYGDAPQAEKTLTREAIEQTPHLGDDINRLVARMPGVANRDYTARLHVRGGADDELLMLVDGMELYDPYHLEPGASLFSIINSRAVGGTDLATGGFSAQYGDRMSGVMDISSTDPTQKNTTNLGVSFLNAHLISEGTFQRGQGEWMAALRRGYMDVMLDLVGDSNTESAPYYGDLLGKLRYRLSDRTSLTGNILYAASDFEMLNEDPDTHQQIIADQKNTYLWAGLETAPRPGLFARTLLYAGRLDREGDGIDYVEFQQNGEIANDRTTNLYGLKQDWNAKLSPSNFLSAGFDIKRVSSDYDYHSFSEITDPLVIGGGPSLVIERDSDFGVSGMDYAAYLSDRIRVAPNFTAELGLRWDYQTYTGDDAQISPRVNLLFELTERDALRAAWGYFNQSQPIHHLQVEDGIEEFYPAQRTESVVLGYERSFDLGLNVGIEAYTKSITSPWSRFENLFHPMEGIGETSSDRIRLDPEEGRAYGVELYAGYQGRGPVRFWLGYVLSRAEDLLEGEWQPRSWDQRHALTFSYNHKIGEKWNFNASGIYHSGWPTTAVAAELRQRPDGSWYVQPILGERNALRFDDYYRLDARASRKVPVRRGSLTFFLEVINLFASENPCCGDDFWYDVQPDGSVEVGRSSEYWLPLLPSFGVNWIF